MDGWMDGWVRVGGLRLNWFGDWGRGASSPPPSPRHAWTCARDYERDRKRLARNATGRLPRDRNKSSPVGWRQMPAESARMETRARSNIRPDPTEESALDVDRDDQYLRN